MMRYLKKRLVRTAAAIIFGCSALGASYSSATAATSTLNDATLAALGVAQDGFNITRDGSNNLDWLDMSLTLNMSVNTVTNTLLGIGQLLDGWRYASGQEVRDLGISAGVPNAYIDPLSSIAAPNAPSTALAALLDALGKSLDVNNGGVNDFEEIYFITGESTSPGTRLIGEIRDTDQTSTLSNWLVTTLVTPTVIGTFNFPDTNTSTHFGHALVQISPIPLPAALPLFGTGLGILGFLGWRRRRKAQAV